MIKYNYFILILWILLQFYLISSEEEKEDFDDDIPIIEGDGGTITTAVEDDVLILTRENFDLQIASKEIILVEFYAPWCGHCKSLAPEYAKAAKILKEEDSKIFLAKVDATLETELASRYDVTGYPTLILFKKGQKIPYEGPRTAMGIVEYVKERSDPNWKSPPEAVLTLTSENFTAVIENSDIILVEFYAPWCGHCKQLAPGYERAAKVLKDASIPLAKVDGIEEKDLAKEYGARGWPTLMIFRKGQKFEYGGPRDESGIISYMKEQAKPPSQEVKSVKEIKLSLGKIDSTVVGFFSSQKNPLYKNFQECGNMLRGKMTFLHSFNKDIQKKFNVNKSSVVLFQPELYATQFEPSKFVLENPGASAKDIKDFIEENLLPLVGERSSRSNWKYKNKYPLVVVYYDVDFSFDHRIQTQLVREEVARVAKDYKGRLTFAVSNEEEYESELIRLNLADSGEDVNVGFFKSEKVWFRMEPVEDFSSDELKLFVENVLAGNIPRHIRSQPVPKDNRGPVLTVVGSTFDELVMQNEKDVVIYFYHPFNSLCEKLEPIYEKLGKAFLNHEHVVIAKMNVFLNDYPDDMTIKDVATIYYIPAKTKDIITHLTYDGSQSLNDLIQFVTKNIFYTDSKDEL